VIVGQLRAMAMSLPEVMVVTDTAGGQPVA
jgi:hypothetical protein